MKHEELSFWMALAHANSFSNRRKMEFLIEAVFSTGNSIAEALENVEADKVINFEFDIKERDGLKASIDNLPNYSFLAEEIVSQDIHPISVLDPEYPAELKKNLGKLAPVLLYAKGNLDLLNIPGSAVVGSRKCSSMALRFTDSIAKQMAEQGKIIISGFAKGVDQQALNSALEHNGQSIIVLPQGIMTYTTKKYYTHIVKGDVLVLSSYHPKTPWSVGLAMDRNRIIYGLANEIFVAESDSKGGTWEGVLNGLRRGRQIKIRVPEENEKNANRLLIQKGAIPINSFGLSEIYVNEQDSSYQKLLSDDMIVDRVEKMLKEESGKGMTSSEILSILQIDKKPQGLTAILKKSLKFVVEKSRGKSLFKLSEKQAKEKLLF